MFCRGLGRMYRAHTLGRAFGTARVALNEAKGASAKTSVKKELRDINKRLVELAKLNYEDDSLATHPELWKGLPDDKIVSLYRTRVQLMGKQYKRTEDELAALLSTAQDPAEAQFIYNVYFQSEGVQFESDTNMDYENYITEGEFLDEDYEPNEYDEYPTIAQDIVRDYRDMMELNRKAAYDMPSLTKFRVPYKPVSKQTKPVTLCYTTYLGESHPGERKVVLSVKVADLALPLKAAHKLKLLAGPRYNYQTDVLKMSSDSFLEAAQNASYLSETLSNLIAEAKKNPDEFYDIPLDTRAVDARNEKKQHKNKRFYEFPEDWKRPLSKKDRRYKWSHWSA